MWTSAPSIRIASLRICLFWILPALSIGLLLEAQPSRAQRFHLDHYDLEDGLPSSHVRDIHQDLDGRLWIAGPGGIASYDGRDWQTFGLADGLAWGDQSFLLRDAGGHLWAVSRHPPYPPSRLAGSRWVATPGPQSLARGLRLRDVELAEDGEGSPDLVYATNAGLLVGRGGEWRRLDRNAGLPSESVHALARWQGGLAIGTEGGLAFYRGGRLVEPPFRSADESLPNSTVYALGVESASGEDGPGERLWIVGDGWIGRVDERETLEVLARDLRFSPSETIEAQPDLLGGLYVAGASPEDGRPSELFHFNPGLLRSVPATQGIYWIGPWNGVENGRVTSLFLDREQNLWIGGERGLCKMPSRHFVHWDRRAGIFDDGVVSIHQSRRGSLIFGHRGGLTALRIPGPEDIEPGRQKTVIEISTRALRLESPDGRRVEPVRDMTVDGQGRLWLAAESAGILRLEGDLGYLDSLEIRRYDFDDGLRGDATAILARGHELWIGTDVGLQIHDLRAEGGPFPIVTLPTGQAHVRRVLDAASEVTWPFTDPQANPAPGGVVIATRSGLHHFDGEDWRSWHCPADLTADRSGACESTFAALRRADGGWWVGTADGIYRTEGDGFGGELVRAEQPALRAIDHPIFFLLGVDDDLWVGTDEGIFRVRSGSDEPEHFSVRDGLAGREMNRAAALRGRKAGLWFGSDRGATVYTPAFDRGRRPPPIMILEAVEAGETVHDPHRPLRLSGSDNDLLFRFHAVSLIDEERVLYRSRLLGFDDAWSTPQRNRDGELRYINVSPGEYHFEVQALSAAGTWSDVARSAPVIVPRPFWLRPWFGALVLASLGLVAWGFVGLVSERRTSRRLEEEVRNRTAELRASEDRYRKTFRAIEDGVVATDAEGRIRLLNPSAEKLTGWNRRQATGRPVEEVLRVHQPADVGATPDDDPPSGQRISLLGEGVEETMGPTRLAVLEARDGRRRHVELTASPIATREHGVTGLVFAFRDVTRRRRIEAELQRTQKLEAVGILAGGIAHDFNNLLQVLMGNLSLVQASAELDPETAKSLADADTALARARDLTQQLLTFSRGGAPVREAAQIAEVIRDSASFVLRGSKVRCRLDLADDLWVVEIDAGQINQVLHNLLLNAAQAMPGGGEVRITARNVTDVPAPLDGPHVCIEVADEGMGIPEEHLPRIFDPYFSTKEEGRGLGLASAYTVVKKHDGLLTVSSRPGRGTTFRIYLPRATGDEVTPTDHRPQATKRSRFEGLRVLLMDDDRAVRRTALAMLERLGCEVVPAEHGAEALALYDAALDEGRRFDVVLMDLTVPGGMGGQQAMERLHALDPDAVGVVYSGYSTDPVLANHREYGFEGRLSKPFRIKELESVLGEVSGD